MLEPQPPRPQANKCWEAGGESGQRRRDGGQLLSQKGLTGEITAVVNPHSFETSFRYDFFFKGGRQTRVHLGYFRGGNLDKACPRRGRAILEEVPLHDVALELVRRAEVRVDVVAAPERARRLHAHTAELGCEERGITRGYTPLLLI